MDILKCNILYITKTFYQSIIICNNIKTFIKEKFIAIGITFCIISS